MSEANTIFKIMSEWRRLKEAYQFNLLGYKITKSHAGHRSILFQLIFAKLNLLALAKAELLVLVATKRELTHQLSATLPLLRERASRTVLRADTNPPLMSPFSIEALNSCPGKKTPEWLFLNAENPLQDHLRNGEQKIKRSHSQGLAQAGLETRLLYFAKAASSTSRRLKDPPKSDI